MNAFTIASCTQPWTIAWHVLVEAQPACASVLDTTDFTFHLTPLMYLGYFALTCAIELPFVYMAVGRKLKQAFAMTLGLNLVTHPFICLVFVNHAQGRTFGEFTLVAETFAFATEMLLISLATRGPRARALAAAAWVFIANAASWTLGAFM